MLKYKNTHVVFEQRVRNKHAKKRKKESKNKKTNAENKRGKKLFIVTTWIFSILQVLQLLRVRNI